MGKICFNISVLLFVVHLITSDKIAAYATTHNGRAVTASDDAVTAPVSKRLFQSNGWGPSGWPWGIGRFLHIPAVDGAAPDDTVDSNGYHSTRSGADDDEVLRYLLSADATNPESAVERTKRLFQSNGWGPSGWLRYEPTTTAAEDAAVLSIQQNNKLVPLALAPVPAGSGYFGSDAETGNVKQRLAAVLPPRRHARFTESSMRTDDADEVKLNSGVSHPKVMSSVAAVLKSGSGTSNEPRTFTKPVAAKFYATVSGKPRHAGGPRMSPALIAAAATNKSRAAKTIAAINARNARPRPLSGSWFSYYDRNAASAKPGRQSVGSVAGGKYVRTNAAFPKLLERLRAARITEDQRMIR